MTFAVVGGGPTGVEIARPASRSSPTDLRHDFSRIDTTMARVILVDAGERVVPAFSEKLSAKTAEGLASARGHGARRSPGHGDRRQGTDGQGRRRRGADRREDGDLGGRRSGSRSDRDHRSGDRRGHRPRRQDRGQPRLHGPGSSRDLRDRRHGEPPRTPTAGRCLASRPSRFSRHTTSRRRSGPGSRAHRPRSATSTRERSPWSAAAGRSARSGAAKSPAASPSTMYLSVHLFYLSGVLGNATAACSGPGSDGRFGVVENRVIEEAIR